jgi:amino acid adenylation domain-containing protein
MANLGDAIQGLTPRQRDLLMRRLEEEARKSAAAVEPPLIPRRPRARGGDSVFPVSFAQQRLWFLDRLEPGTPLYNIPAAITARGRLEVAALAAGLGEIVRRHETLRTTFALRDAQPVQVVHPPAAGPLPLPIVDLGALPGPARRAEAGRLATAEARRPFDLEAGPLLRALLLRLGAEEHEIVLAVHHVVSDGWSMGVLVRELGTLYPAHAAGREVRLPELPVQYADFAVWQRERANGEASPLAAEIAFWRERLAGAPTALELPTDRPRLLAAGGGAARGAQAPVRLAAPRVAALRERSRSAGGTLFMTLLAAFQELLRRYTGQESLLIGSPIANRRHAELEPLIGFFVNTLVLRADLHGDPTVRELLARVREGALAAYAHQDLPFEKLVEELRPERDAARSPLFQGMLTVQPAAAEALSLPGLTLAARDLDTGTAKFELVLHLAEGAETVDGWLEYDAGLFDATTMARMGEQLETLLGDLADGDPERRLSDLSLQPPALRQALLAEWNDTAAAPPSEVLLHRLVEAQARLRPDAVALVEGEREISFGELDRRSRRLAHRLAALGVGPEVRVGLCLERSAERVVAVLGVLAAGGAYVPLDPSYPAERLAFMLADSEASLLLCGPGLEERLPEIGLPAILLEGGLEGGLDGREDGGGEGAPLREPGGDNLAYVIYTSGSTGRPKGVMVRHRALCRTIASAVELYGLRPGERVPQLASLSFDASVLEIFATLAAGATLVLFGPEVPPLGSGLAAELRLRGITWLIVVPSLLESLPADELPALRGATLGGEACPPALADRWTRGRTVVNCYAPTEATIFAAAERCAGPFLQGPPLGRPIAGSRLYVLDPALRPAPPGAVGEVYIGGEGVARGYHGLPDLTAERFVPDPFAEEPGARLYRTGDLARQLADGRLDFAGRGDTQVKIRGHRIELGEIEAALDLHPAIERGLAAAREDTPGDRRLVAYAAIRPGQAAPTLAELRAFLRERLPEPYLPSAFVALDRLPFTPTGKPDRKALPAPASNAPGAAEPRTLPRSHLERAIAAVWQEALRVPRVGLEDNFFDLGGHSLLLAQVHARLLETLGLAEPELGLIDLFRHPTVAALAARIGGPSEGAGSSEEGSAASGIERALARREELARERTRRDTAVAIVGMSGRFPGADGVEAFWRNLTAGVESITFFTDEQTAKAGVPASMSSSPGYVRARGVLSGVDRFDAGFFGYSPREAEIMDPQQRLFLECAWEAFEDAGWDPARCPGGAGDVGVFAGVGLNTYVLNLLPNPEILDSVGNFQITIANDKDFLAPRVSYKLGLRGPSVSVQTACSTSLVAVHLACQSLISGECDAALAGGVSIRVPQEMGYHHHEGAVFSPDGHCRAFDAAAGGFVGGNGVAAVLLKRLADARRDGDHVYAVIRGSAVNNDGARKVGFTAPGVEGQARVIAEALAVAGIEPETVSYVEAHGTGTELGDPIEVAALSQAFGERPERGSCALGSVKTNIGHLDSAAGAAGLIKAALALERRRIPATLHFERANPRLELERTPFYVNDRLAEWPSGPAPRRAGVSSMGIGGTNAHVVLEEAPAAEPLPVSRSWQLLPLSARSETALEAQRENLARWLREHPEAELADVAFTLQAGRRRFDHRAVALARDVAEAVEVLEGGDPERLLFGAPGDDSPRVAFLLSGQGSQHPGMAAELYRTEELFRREVDRGCERLVPILGLDLRALLFPEPGEPGEEDEAGRSLERTELTQPALFVVEHALARLWMAWGVKPQALLGHSVGELVAATLAGVLPFEDALAVVAERGRLMGEREPGAMLSVQLPEAETVALLEPGVALAAVNGPARCVVAGPAEAIDALAARLAAGEVPHRRLRTSHAFHSAAMEPAVEPFAERLRAVALQAPAIPFVSDLTGSWITAAEATDPAYWARQMRAPVRFADGLAALLDEPGRLLLEVGPGNALTTFARESGAGVALASLPHPGDRRSDHAFVLAALARVWLAGGEIDWAAFHGEPRRRVPLPTYPFERRRYWIEGTGPFGLLSAGRRGDLSRRPDPADWLYAPTWKRSLAVPAAPADDPRRILVLAEEADALGERLIERLGAAGHDVVTVLRGGELHWDGGDVYRLAAGDRDAYFSLIAGLRASGRLPDAVVHLWTLAPCGFEKAQERGFRSLVFLAQALSEAGTDSPVDLTVVTAGLYDVDGREALRPELATLLGPMRVLPWESPRLSCRVVDLPGDGPDLAERLAAELGFTGGAGPAEPTEPEVALRGAARWVPAWEPVRLEAAPGTSGIGGRLRAGGVYLITGGLGGVGLELAERLARAGGVKLALLGRTPLPPRERWDEALAGEDAALARRLRRLIALEQAGAEVLPLSADVTDRDALAGALARVRERFGALHGVVHAAGVAGGGLIQRRTVEDARAVLAPRVEGLRLLSELLAGEPLDFLVLIAALGAVTGEPGQVAFCAANAYLDAWAVAAARDPRAPWTVAIDWDTWREVGMAAMTAEAARELPEPLRRMRELALATAVAPAEGREVFGRILERARGPRIAVSTRDLEAAIVHARELARGAFGGAGGSGGPGAGGGPAAGSSHARPELRSSYLAPRDETEEAIARVWQELLGIDRVGVHDNFFDLGGHSLLATQVLARLRAALGLELPLEALFDSPTVAGLAASVAGRKAPLQADELDALLREIESLSAEEAREALHDETRRSPHEPA